MDRSQPFTGLCQQVFVPIFPTLPGEPTCTTRDAILHSFLGRRHSGLELAHEYRAKAAECLGSKLLRSKVHGNPEFGAVEVTDGDWELEVAGHDADNEVRFAIEQNLCAKDVRVTVETALPAGVAEDRNLLPLRVFLRCKDTAQQWSDAQRGEDGGRHAGGQDLSGLTDAR